VIRLLLTLGLAVAFNACSSNQPAAEEKLEHTGEDAAATLDGTVDSKTDAFDDDQVGALESKDAALVDAPATETPPVETAVQQAPVEQAPAMPVEEPAPVVDAVVPDAFEDAKAPAEEIPVEKVKAKKSKKKAVAKAKKSKTAPAIVAASDSASSGAGDASYVVLPGDNLGKISQMLFGTSSKWLHLKSMNNLTDANKIFPGDKLTYNSKEASPGLAGRIAKNTTKVTVKKGETLSKLSKRLYGTEGYWKVIWHYNDSAISNPNKISVGQTLIVVKKESLSH